MDIFAFLEKYESVIDRFRQSQQRYYLAIILGLGLYLSMNILFPAWQEFRQTSKELNAYQQTLSKKRLNSLNKEEMEKEINAIQTQLKAKQSQFFSPSEFNEFSLNTLSKMAESYNNTVLTLRYKGLDPRGAQMETRPITITLEGPFLGIMGFIQELETFGKFVRVLSLSITQKSVTPTLVSAVLELEPYVIP